MESGSTEPIATRWQFTFRVSNAFSVKQYQGSAIRGILGHGLKQAHCVFPHREHCKGCLFADCAYRVLFEDTDTTINLGFGRCDLPRPYVVEALDYVPRAYQVGELFAFNIVLWGLAQKLHSSVLAVCKSYFADLEWVDCRILAECAPMHGVAEEGNAAQLCFYTPLRLVRDGKLTSPGDWSAASWVMSLVRRVYALNLIYANGFSADLGALGALAQTLELDAAMHLQDWGRYSNRQQARMDLPGYVGAVCLQGDLGPFFDYLRQGVFAHMGKGCVFGLGGYTLTCS